MSDDFASPRTDDESRIDVDNEDAPRLGVTTYLAAGMMLISGMFGGAYALQLLVFIVWYTSAWIAPFVFGTLSAAIVVLAAVITTGRPKVVLLAATITGFQLLIAIAWNIYALLQTLFSPLGILWMLACFPTVVLVPFALGPSARLAAYRRKLLEGLDAP